MAESIFSVLASLEDFIWGYLAFPLLISLGLFFSFKTRFVQIRHFPTVLRTFFGFLRQKEGASRGVHPLKAFFACVGGCVGVGNVVSICTGIQLGGPGALFWIWVTAVIGMMIKYAEVYLGIRYREPNDQGGYNGGPMYFLKKAFRWRAVGSIAALLLCIYGVEIYQFSVVVHSISHNWSMNSLFVTFAMLALVIFAGSGGVQRVGTISSASIPLFVVLYLGMGCYVLFANIEKFPSLLANVFTSAFSGHAAFGGFVGSTLLMTISQGIRRGCYTGDIAVGYASIINSETSANSAEKQASLEFFGLAFDTFFICTMSILLILITDVWVEPIPGSLLVQTALGQQFPFMNYFMPFFLFLLGYNTINAYFIAGLKCATYLAPKWGKTLFYSYAVIALLLFSFVRSIEAQSVMAIVGGLLLLINTAGIYRLRNEVNFNFAEEEGSVCLPCERVEA